MKEYRPIRIVKDIQIAVKSRAEAQLRYPHGEVKSIPVRYGLRLPSFTVMYLHPQRINVPTEDEVRRLVDTGCAKFIPQHKELQCDDPASELSGSRSMTRRHKRKAMKEINESNKPKAVVPEVPEVPEVPAVVPEKPAHEPKARKRTYPISKPSEPSESVENTEKINKEASDV